MPYADPEVRKQYLAEYRRKNRDQILAKGRKRYREICDTPEEKERRRAYRQANREQIRARHRRDYIRNPEKHKERQLLHNYGIDLPTYKDMVNRQNNKCAICRTTGNTLHVDHNHSTNKVRALLCPSCNTALGLLKENPVLLRTAAAYIEAFNV